MKRILVFLLSLIFLVVPFEAFSQTYFFYRYRNHATDCTSLTDGKIYDLCYETDDQVLYKCSPSAGDCDNPSEWKISESNLRFDPGGCGSGSYVTDIAQDGTLSCSALSFADTDNNFSAVTLQSAIEEFDDINLSGPNATDAKVDWSQIGNIPSGFADGNDATGGGGGGAGNCWEADGNGDLQPVSGSCTDSVWELDGNGDLQPKT